MRNQKIVVVGGGIVGLATAWHLQRGGAEVSVVERHGVAAGASWGNAGWLAPALTLPLPEPAILATGIRALLSPKSPVYVPPRLDPRLLGFLAGFARHCTDRRWRAALQVFIEANASALDAYDELATATGAGVEEPIRSATPMLAAFASETDREVLLDEFRRVNSDGGRTDYALLDDAAVHELEPALGPGVRCGLRIDGQRFINPGRFVHSLADAVKEAGAEIVTGREVSDVAGDGGRPRVRFTDGDALEADDVVLANGAWLGRLARQHGVRRLVQAGRGYSFTVRPDAPPRNPIYFPTQRVACTPLGGPEDGLRVAGMMEFRDPDAPLDPRRVDAIVEAAGPMFTGIDFAARRDEWVGSRPCTTDGLPLVGRTRTPGVHVAGGHGMWGVALGPLTGRLLAGQILRGETGSVLRHFDPLR
ncbi:FAD-binding oxidoreductase [Pseudonocardia sp. C8]|uniref:NAD(P)/FAD-dependent oxidoreductase n=1 Tax=Pseudonocardia sp. C8 TaxID=2762759 RepID=UPI00164292D7|nr:FAD-dependent oxidoreductase [Pseudonocardia sp. C8]MBC3194292.1 FAD-binding oxidoreductase [Pseudonocardia sp. C8]